MRKVDLLMEFEAGKREGRNLAKDLEPDHVTRVGLISN
jgi:hypothetical protein